VLGIPLLENIQSDRRKDVEEKRNLQVHTNCMSNYKERLLESKVYFECM
jgi:hypothetical protein